MPKREHPAGRTFHQRGAHCSSEATVRDLSRQTTLDGLFALFCCGGWRQRCSANLVPDWLVRLPVGRRSARGLAGIVLDDAGNSYITGISGSSSNTDITTAAYEPDGTLVWSRTFNGPENWHDQARGLALSRTAESCTSSGTPRPAILRASPAAGL